MYRPSSAMKRREHFVSSGRMASRDLPLSWTSHHRQREREREKEKERECVCEKEGEDRGVG